jgi:hypothetical protein
MLARVSTPSLLVRQIERERNRDKQIEGDRERRERK